jgi:hypothetical protein
MGARVALGAGFKVGVPKYAAVRGYMNVLIEITAAFKQLELLLLEVFLGVAAGWAATERRAPRYL